MINGSTGFRLTALAIIALVSLVCLRSYYTYAQATSAASSLDSIVNMLFGFVVGAVGVNVKTNGNGT